MKNYNLLQKIIAGYKRYLLTVFGIILISASMFLAYKQDSILDIICSILLIMSGCIFIVASIRLIPTGIMSKYMGNSTKGTCGKDIDDYSYEKKILDKVLK
ncbi:2-phospho-L-lactate transferase [Acetivibrio straminisolvens JCM 21531]|uniref:2-phospho-L-lactate transferase n=1 Tax=Acetivibrio straminisolvens JCM 21531 TaxID=1294263 RepID=W4V4P5_9FIRM|nr:2-phospho-L-lactate transferase [Acetivibrio straminisolvens JCM 21531]